LLRELGVRVSVEFHDSAAAELERLVQRAAQKRDADGE
jgi:hypothetical protein